MCLKKISLSEKYKTDEDILRNALLDNSEICKKKYTLPYNPYVPIEMEYIYKPFKTITIGK